MYSSQGDNPNNNRENIMKNLEVTKIENELYEMIRKNKTLQNKNTVVCGGPKLKRTYKYKHGNAF
jgi:hypothetical protein|tara:strand:+ start:219 stop:413 length:195 start_codon:yes stop_codon:yes gene_type:complete